MKIVVTGGSGFIGSHIIDALRREGHTVTNLDVRDGTVCDHFSSADIRDVDEVARILDKHGRDAVFHLAAIANARLVLDEPVSAVDMNIRGTASILEAARRTGVGRMILASTVWYYNAVERKPEVTDLQPTVLDETASILPDGGGHVYTTTKIAAELLCHDFHKLYGQEFTILRFGIPYGPRMWPGLALRAFLDGTFSGKPIRIFGDGNAVRRFVYVEDLAHAHVLALSDVARSQTYNLEGERDVTIRELAETVIKHVGKGTIEYVVDPTRRGELVLDNTVVSNEKARLELGWTPETSLNEGVRRTVEWYRSECVPDERG